MSGAPATRTAASRPVVAPRRNDSRSSEDAGGARRTEIGADRCNRNHPTIFRASCSFVIGAMPIHSIYIIKIEMTPRLKPVVHGRELGDTSVPFGFDFTRCTSRRRRWRRDQAGPRVGRKTRGQRRPATPRVLYRRNRKGEALTYPSHACLGPTALFMRIWLVTAVQSHVGCRFGHPTVESLITADSEAGHPFRGQSSTTTGIRHRYLDAW